MSIDFSLYQSPILSASVLSSGGALSADFSLANDNRGKMKQRIERNPSKALCHAILGQNDVAVHMALECGIAKGYLNKALFLATGYTRDQYREPLLSHGASLRQIPSGMLLRHTLEGEIGGVRYSLNNPAIDVNVYDQYCFKQAIRGDKLDIAELLYDAGTDLTEVLGDELFMDDVNRLRRISPEAKSLITRLTGEFKFGEDRGGFVPSLVVPVQP